MLTLTIKFIVTCCESNTQDLKDLLNRLKINNIEMPFKFHVDEVEDVPKVYFTCSCDEKEIENIKKSFEETPYHIHMRYGEI